MNNVTVTPLAMDFFQIESVGFRTHRGRRQLGGDPLLCLLAIVAEMNNVLRQPPQVIDQAQSQHDWDRPQFSHGQGRGRLYRLHEARDVVLIQAAVAVRGQVQRDGIDARITRQRPGPQLGQPIIVTHRQVDADFRQGVADDIKIVEQPLGVMPQRFPLAISFGDASVRVPKDLRVAQEHRWQRSSSADDHPGAGYYLAQLVRVSIQMIQAKQLGSYRMDALVNPQTDSSSTDVGRLFSFRRQASRESLKRSQSCKMSRRRIRKLDAGVAGPLP